jgi:hypothetical protein
VKFPLQTFVCWRKCSMFIFPHYDLALMLCVGLQRPTLFLQRMRKSKNVPLVFQTLWLQHVGCVRHHIIIVREGLSNACLSKYCVGLGNAVVHLVWTMRIVLKPPVIDVVTKICGPPYMWMLTFIVRFNSMNLIMLLIDYLLKLESVSKQTI